MGVSLVVEDVAHKGNENTQPTTICTLSRDCRISVVHEADRGNQKPRLTHRWLFVQ